MNDLVDHVSDRLVHQEPTPHQDAPKEHTRHGTYRHPWNPRSHVSVALRAPPEGTDDTGHGGHVNRPVRACVEADARLTARCTGASIGADVDGRIHDASRSSWVTCIPLARSN